MAFLYPSAASHVLRGLLPPPSIATQQYSLRRRPHDRQMPDHTGHLADKNLLIRMLYKDSYWLFLYCNSVFSVSTCVLSYVNKEMIDWLIEQISNSLGTSVAHTSQMSCVAWILKQHQVVSIQTYRPGIFVFVEQVFSEISSMIMFLSWEIFVNRPMSAATWLMPDMWSSTTIIHWRLTSIKHFFT